MENKLTQKVLKELDEKLKNIDASTIATYLMISTYVIKEEFNIKYRSFLSQQPNTIDYLFETFNRIKEETINYELVRKCLNADESKFVEFNGIFHR